MDRRYGESLDHWQTNPKKDDDANFDKQSIAHMLYGEACRLNDEKRYNEALTLINVAIENENTNYKYHDHKGTILENLTRYNESRQAYDDALEINDNGAVNENKARMLYKWANSLNDKERALDLITEAIEILPLSVRDTYFEKFWYLRGSILDCLGRKIESRRCYLIAEGMTDELNELDSQVDLLTNSKDTLINITGTRFYFGMEPFKKGVTLNLIKENDNEHDPDAIRVEIEGETVGYVANNDHTLIENVKSASEIRSMNPKSAEVVMIYMDDYIIARII